MSKGCENIIRKSSQIMLSIVEDKVIYYIKNDYVVLTERLTHPFAFSQGSISSFNVEMGTGCSLDVIHNSDSVHPSAVITETNSNYQFA
jgi:hypothetical protein